MFTRLPAGVSAGGERSQEFPHVHQPVGRQAPLASSGHRRGGGRGFSPPRCSATRNCRKHCIDTLKMLAYQAETSMASTVREKLARSDDARALLRPIYNTEVDLLPDPNTKTLTVTSAKNSRPSRPLSQARISAWCTNLSQPKFHEIRSSETRLDATCCSRHKCRDGSLERLRHKIESNVTSCHGENSRPAARSPATPCRSGQSVLPHRQSFS